MASTMTFLLGPLSGPSGWILEILTLLALKVWSTSKPRSPRFRGPEMHLCEQYCCATRTTRLVSKHVYNRVTLTSILPLGFCYPKETILAYCRFAEKHNLHLYEPVLLRLSGSVADPTACRIVDEIYALSLYQNKCAFHPLTEVRILYLMLHYPLH